MNAPLLVTSSPHLRSSATTRRIMLDVLLALLPAMGASVYFFGVRAALVILVTVASTMLTEFVTRKWILKRDFRLGDLSAVVTGVLLALTLPPSVPLWIAAVGGVLAIFLVKEIFGGLGQNFMNPALGARVFLFLAWPAAMTNWVQ
ncbi:MAG: RnfABCDGE type electron transport complex subunit D, partial [Spirochaetales bacterium]|nr:RnfABCDGE type electron transport complex subunit D [Spirochaetales bacterium]